MSIQNILIALFTLLSYYYGAKAILENRYKPNVFSRIIWLLVALNGLASVVALKNASSTVVFASMGFLGSFLILVLSLRTSRKIFGSIELISTVLLVLSLVLWFVMQAPFLNLIIGLVITFIGGIPTLISVLRDPKSEDIPFWLFFALASLVACIDADWSTVSGYIFSIFYLCFNAGMTLLCLRRYLATQKRK